MSNKGLCSEEISDYLLMTLSLEVAYDIAISCNDHYDVYEKYKIADAHYTTKTETALVESFNSLDKALFN